MKKFMWLIFLLGAVNTYAQWTVSGTVRSVDGTPVQNANVVLLETEKTGKTDENGKFSFSNIESGDYSLLVSHVSYSAVTRDISVNGDIDIRIEMEESLLVVDQVVIEATRADANTPTTFSELDADDLQRVNYGQDIPVMLEFTPSVVSTSDAGAGIGYTGIRIRGSDATRINVTINGIPLNDSESHGVFWVNTPDLASSTSSIQIQRGVGTSTNGAAAFGASINLLTDTFEEDPYAELNTGIGSYNTFRNTLRFGTGLISDRWSVDGRFSAISSDGYIDRARADLRSYYLSGLYAGKRTTVRLLTFAGQEETYQAWWGTPEARINNDVAGMNLVADYNWYSQEQRDNLLNSGRTFNYYLYENEVDNYRQDHYQAHVSTALTDDLQLNLALHYTYGRGYFEQYRAGEDFVDYDLQPIDTPAGQITSTDLVRRRWLDNHFYGTTFSLQYQGDRFDLTWGGAANTYDGDHFGEVIWAQYAPNIPKDYRYYDNTSSKRDINSYLKGSYELGDGLFAFADLQVRNIAYEASGPDNDRVGGVPLEINVDENYTFFNPKLGLTWFPNTNTKLYGSYAVAHREPVRSDFIDNQNGTIPSPEKLQNVELGIKHGTSKLSWELAAYLMNYRDQLVLTGELNDVGSPIRANVDRSYRAGIELSGNYIVNKFFSLAGNTTFSRNKILSYDEYLYDYGINWDEFNIETTSFEDTDIAFSPSVIAAGHLIFNPIENLETMLTGKYVGPQFLDNTSNEDRSIDEYFVSFFRASYAFKFKGVEELRLGLLVNNLFNQLYENNGYTFGYKGGGAEIRENYYYPQAERNFLISLNLKF